MANIMMDIETLGTNFNAVVLQITMVKFNWDKSITSRITVNISIEEQLIKGRTIDESTVNWWKEQKSDVFESCIKEQKKPLEALNELKRFVNYDDVVWSHATFDAPIVASLFNDFGIRVPWKYTNARDIRTLIDMSEINLNDYNWEKKTHNSNDDCEFQIDYCCDAYNSIKTWKSSFIKCTNNISREQIIEKIRTLRNDYIISGNEKNKIFMQYNQTKEMKDRFNELHMKQNDIINEISIYETWLKQFEDKIS